MIFVREDLQSLFPEKSIDEFLAIEGEVYKHVVSSRRTLRFERNGRDFFLKAHWGIGWREIFKDLTSLRLPVVSARNEWLAIQKMHEIGVETMTIAAYGESDEKPAKRRSFLVTEALEGTEDLEHWLPRLTKQQRCGPKVKLKRKVMKKVANIAKLMHDCGMNHRDFYMCHFRINLDDVVDKSRIGRIAIYLMDLHRAQIRSTVPLRWRVKDIAGLLYSAMFSCKGLRITTGDYIRFIETYSGLPWRQSVKQNRKFWLQVIARVRRTYRSDYKKKLTLPRFLQI